MIGREHQHDENGNTRYECASITMPFMPTTLSQAVNNAVLQVGWPATTTPAKFASRDSMKIDDGYFLNLDVGGEGYHSFSGVTSGFVGAININDKERGTQPSDGPIPQLILVGPWEKSPPYPFADRTANYITMQGAPLTNYYVGEMARVIAPGRSDRALDRRTLSAADRATGKELQSTAVSECIGGINLLQRIRRHIPLSEDLHRQQTPIKRCDEGRAGVDHSFWNSLSVALIKSLSGCSAQYWPSFLALTTRAAVSITGGSSSSL